MSNSTIHFSFFFVLFISISCAPSIRRSSLQDDFSTEQLPEGKGMWSFLRNFFANLLATLSGMINSNQGSNTESDRPGMISSMLDTIVEALRSGNASRLIDSIMDQFNQMVGRIGQMYSDGVEREVYVVDRSPKKVDSKDRVILNNLVTKMRLTQSNIEQLSNVQNASDLSMVETKINSIKSNLNEIWNNLKNMYSEYNMKSTNVSNVLDRLDFLDPKQVKLTAGELQTQLNKLWRDLSRNLMQTIDQIDLRVKRITKQTLEESKHLSEDVGEKIRKKFKNSTDEAIASFKSFRGSIGDAMKERLTSNETEFDLLEIDSTRLEGEQRDRLKKALVSEPRSNQFRGKSNSETSDKIADDKVPLNRYLRSVDRLQIESEKLLTDDLRNLIGKSFDKPAKLQMQNKTDNQDSNSSNDSDSSNESLDASADLDFQNESQLKKWTNMLRAQFNQSMNQFTNYWKSVGTMINERRKSFNMTGAGRKMAFSPFGFKIGNKNDDEDASNSSDHPDDYSDFSSSDLSYDC